MPGLNKIDPQGELVRRITALEVEQRRVATIRREPATNGYVVKNGDQAIAATTYTKVTGWTLGYANPGDTWDAAASTYTPASSGVYLVVASVVWKSGTGADSTLLFFSDDDNSYLPGSGRVDEASSGQDSHLSCIMLLTKGVPYYLSVYRYTAVGTILAGHATLQIHRLSDLPANA